jgi:hypothetical protein
MTYDYSRDELMQIAKLGIGAYERIRGLDERITAAILELQVYSEHGGCWGEPAAELGALMRRREDLLELARPPA